MTTIRKLTMRSALRSAASGKLEDGWLYLPNEDDPDLETPCLLIDLDSDEDPLIKASELGFTQEGLDTETIVGTCHAASQFKKNPSDELLLESFIYYWRFDAWLPKPGAPKPLTGEEAQLRDERNFYVSLGEERADVICKTDDCQRGAVKYSVFCRVHHFEMIRKLPCPFWD
jgi:hypothetical protein